MSRAKVSSCEIEIRSDEVAQQPPHLAWKQPPQHVIVERSECADRLDPGV